jgi:hypothetical protein
MSQYICAVVKCWSSVLGYTEIFTFWLLGPQLKPGGERRRRCSLKTQGTMSGVLARVGSLLQSKAQPIPSSRERNHVIP